MNCREDRQIVISDIPAEVGIQRFQLLALGPRFREDDELMGRRNSFARAER